MALFSFAHCRARKSYGLRPYSVKFAYAICSGKLTLTGSSPCILFGQGSNL